MRVDLPNLKQMIKNHIDKVAMTDSKERNELIKLGVLIPEDALSKEDSE